MGLSQALSTAMSGLRVTQASLALVSANVANAETPGYVKKTINQVAGTTGEFGSSVLINGVNRQLDQYLQTQLRTENSGASYASIRSTFLANLQNVYGNPDDSGTIEYAFNNLLTAVQGLSTSPDSQSARIGAVAAAQAMAQQLNSTTQGIQTLRANAETGINDAVIAANNAMAQIAKINVQLQNNGQTDASTASLRVAQLRVLGGAMARVPVEATAFAHRRSRIMVNCAAICERPEDMPKHAPWVTGFAAALRQGDAGAYVNFLADEGAARVRAAYTDATWDRLAAIKSRSDPTTLFHLNQNIPPSERS